MNRIKRLEIIELVRAGKTSQEIADLYNIPLHRVSEVRKLFPLEKESKIIEANMHLSSVHIKGLIPYMGIDKIISELTKLGKWKTDKSG